MRHPVTLVTGGSSGIGAALAAALARRGDRLVLVARSAEALKAVATRIEAETGARTLTIPLDLADPGAPAALRARLDADGLTVRRLVNNAGYGLAGEAAGLDARGQLGIVDLNCRAVLALTLEFLPDILQARGGLLTVASVASFTAGPGFAAYYASKAFALSLSRALHVELKARGVSVTALCPGPTATAFGVRAGLKPGRRAARWLVLWPAPDAEAVAAAGLAAWEAGRAVAVPGWGNRLGVMLLRALPQRLVLPGLYRAQRRRRAGPGEPLAPPAFP